MTGRTLVLTAGRFGEAVAETCAETGAPVAALPLAGFADGRTPLPEGIGFAVLALAVRDAGAAGRLDRVFWTSGLSWTQVTLEGTTLRAGPLVVPGRSACHGCYRTRWLANSQVADRELALDAALARMRQSGSGIAGVTLPLARIAAALALTDRRDAGEAAGRVRWFDFRSCTLREERVTRVHGCPLCGDARLAGARYWAHLETVLSKAGIR